MDRTKLNVFDTYTLPNGVTLKNRLMMAPMTTCSGFHDGCVTQDQIDYYRARSGDIGAVILECGFVEKRGQAFPGAIGIEDDAKLEGLTKLAQAVKEKGSKAIIQIYHGGRMVDPKFIGGLNTVAPSSIPAARTWAPTPTALTENEVHGMIKMFSDATRRAIQAGFDGIEIHGANTYIIQQFYSPNSNQRDDMWGGDRDKRANFPLLLVDSIHQTIAKYADKSFIVGYRFSPEELEIPGLNFDDTLYLLEKLAEKNLDYFHFSMDKAFRSSIIEKQDPTPLITKYCQQRSDRLAQIPIVGVGGIVNREDADKALEGGYDLLAVGKACIAYPDWVKRIQNNEKLLLEIDSEKREELSIPEPLWRFPLVDSLVRDMNVSKCFKPGVYPQKEVGDSFELSLNIHLAEDHIKYLELLNEKDIDPELVKTFAIISEQIVKENSPHVDSVAGATAQCEAIKKATIKAMALSTKQAIIEAGGDPNDLHTDVVVIGSGGAGLAAAIYAHDLGVKVIIVEKMPTIGGNTIKASAGMNAAETKFQKLKGIKDSKELFYQETLTAGKGKNNPQLLKYFVDHGSEAINWLDTIGIELSGITTTGGMSIDRTHRPVTGDAVGGYLVGGLVHSVNKRKIPFLLETEATKILQENGHITGVEIHKEDGISIINCKTVIVTTGGFSANTEMVEHYRPNLKDFVTTNHKGAMGSGIKLLQQLGADTVDMSEIQIHPTVEQTRSYLISESLRGGGAVLISQAGKRFFNELSTRDKVSEAIINLPEHSCYILFDQQVRDENKAIEEYVSRGLVVEAPTLSELAEKLKIEPSVLIQTIERYNGFVAQQQDDDFGRNTGMRHPCDQGPYYVIKVAPGVHHTMGGVVVNTKAEVLNAQGNIIIGAYAAGEVVGGVHGANRVGGNAVADIVIFGLRAGQSAADYINK